ncbi:MAG TPA: hypothetical protein VK118_09640 [Tetragenococcus sp.]|nr:hypothetical protein [Tetragenococcus sp.]
MTAEEYKISLEQLKAGELREIVVEQEDFSNFRRAWLTFTDRMHFVGEAGLNGKIVYHYEEEAR